MKEKGRKEKEGKRRKEIEGRKEKEGKRRRKRERQGKERYERERKEREGRKEKEGNRRKEREGRKEKEEKELINPCCARTDQPFSVTRNINYNNSFTAACTVQCTVYIHTLLRWADFLIMIKVYTVLYVQYTVYG